MRKVYYSFLLLLVAIFVACSTDDNVSKKSEGNGDTPSNTETEMVESQLTGFVRDTEGNPLSGVTVSSGTQTLTTNSSGMFYLSKIGVNDGRTVLSFQKDGYFNLVRSFEQANGDEWEVTLCSKSDHSRASTTSYSSSSAQTLLVGNMKVQMPKDGYVVNATGKNYSGQVEANMLYLNPNDEHFSEMMPGGDLAAVRTDGSETQLISYGMTDVNMMDGNGNKLQLKEGSTATVTFPIPEGMEADAPVQIPLWSFNEETGLWEEEGVANLQGNTYVGEVSHFSWLNLDYPEKQGLVKGHVYDTKGNPLKGVRVQVGQLLSKLTNSEGYYEQTVPANEDFTVSVKSAYYGNYTSGVSVNVPALQPDEKRTVDLTLPHLNTVSGTIVNEAGSLPICAVWITYVEKGVEKKTTSVCSDSDGSFKLYCPSDYEGNATLVIKTGDGDIVNTDIFVRGKDINVGNIRISSVISEEGIIHVNLSNGSTVSFSVKNPSNTGVMVIDDRLIYSTDDDESTVSTNFYLKLEGYKDGKTDYENADIYVSDKNESKYFYSFNEYGANNSISINRKNDKFVFQMEGKGTYYNASTEDAKASFVGKDIALNLFYIGKTLHNVKPTSAGFPSFTPELSTAAPIVFLITESPVFGKGGVIYYNGTESDYNTLKKAASKAGLSKIGEDTEDGYAYVAYYSNGKMISIEYDEECDEVTSDQSAWDVMQDNGAPLEVQVFDGINESMLSYLAEAKTRSLSAKAHCTSKKMRAAIHR